MTKRKNYYKRFIPFLKSRKKGNLTIEEGIEDIHSQIEKELTTMPGRYRQEDTYRKVKE